MGSSSAESWQADPKLTGTHVYKLTSWFSWITIPADPQLKLNHRLRWPIDLQLQTDPQFIFARQVKGQLVTASSKGPVHSPKNHLIFCTQKSSFHWWSRSRSMSGTKIKPFTDGADAEVCLAQKLYCTPSHLRHPQLARCLCRDSNYHWYSVYRGFEEKSSLVIPILTYCL